MEAAESEFVDFATLDLTGRPNAWLVAPETAVRTRPNALAPSFDVPPARLARAWLAVVRAEPNTVVHAVSTDGLRIEISQRSRIFRFVDRISTSVIALGPDDQRSTLAIYSRSLVGYWDFGVNRRRVETWLAALNARLIARGGGTASLPHR